MIVLTDKGLYCEAGDFYIDPNKSVDIALITHAHSDHARKGSHRYICVNSGKGLLSRRLGHSAKIEGVAYREPLKFGQFGDVTVSFHPAGHILGSAQIRVQRGSAVWVVSGDYKREADPTCEPFEVLACDTFITEATFGHPKYEWGQSQASREIFEWWETNRQAGENSLLFCYALGKTQRILAELLTHTNRPVYLFGEANALTACYREEGVKMIPTRDLELWKKPLQGELILAAHSISNSPWVTQGRLGEYHTAFASGWMRTGAFGMYRQYDRGFVLSDHADFPALVQTARETGARQVQILHGSKDGFLGKALRNAGIHATYLKRPSSKPPQPEPVQALLF